jgi:epoxyqueuosine reductase QueG
MSADTEALRAGLRRIASGMGAAALGVADLGPLRGPGGGPPPELADGFSRAVVLGARLQDAVLDRIEDRPTPLYLHHYRQANYLLDRAAFAAADFLQSAGFAALAVPASQYVERDPPRGQLSHRLLGRAAGLGFIGRNALLVNPACGARMRYVSVLTDAPLRPDAPAGGDCGQCRACVEACPAGAIGERAEDFRADACRAKLEEFARLPFVGQHICGVCVKACRGQRR